MSGAPHSTSQQRLTHGVTVVVGDADGDRARELDTAGDMAGVTEGDTDGTVPKDTDADGELLADLDTHWHTRGMPLQTTAPRHGVTLGVVLLDTV
jgi:hypothetical protein